MKWRNRNRWGDNDRNWGPFTYARDGRAYRSLAVVLKSRGDDDDESGDCTLRISGFGHTLITTVPSVIRPWRRWVDLSNRQFYAADGSPEPLQPGRGYWDVHARQYGFSLDGAGDVGRSSFLQVFLGPQTHDSRTTKSWSYFLPWTEWRHVRRSLYGLDGEHVWTEPPGGWRLGDGSYEARKAAEEACPSRIFAFRDFDGEALTVQTRIEEREWRFGSGWFRWLSIFRKPMIHRSLDLQFSGETGKRKGSWKGGTLGHAIEMRPGELHEPAFRRYCDEHGMTFVGPASPPPPRGPRS